MMEAGCGVATVVQNAASGPLGEPGSGDVLEGAMPQSTKPDGEQKQPDQHKSTTEMDISPHERTMVQTVSYHNGVGSDELTGLPVDPEPTLRSCVSTASMKVKHMKKLTFPRGHFPRLAECAHFHYETVDFGSVQLAFAEEQTEGQKTSLDSKEPLFLVQICCQSRSWLVKRSYEDLRVLDKHLHLCIYDRRFSQLTELPRFDSLKDRAEEITKMLTAYLSRLSAIADNKINCGPVLTWMEIDNKGNHLLVAEESSINVPAIAAAHVIKRYVAQATDELTFEVGDIVSVIDMPPKEDTGWWRGKHGFQVGFFPCDCVELISDKIPPCVPSHVPKPVCKKHGKLVTFLRSFMKSRPPPQKLRQRGILRERVFGCDLGEHLLNSGHDVPQVIKCCTEFIEEHGVVDGMYRLSGISSNIQKLRHEFDSEQIPDLSRDVFKQDIHSVGSLCKLYFRELPNPLLTYQLYERFSEAVSAATDEERLVKIHNVIQQLPPPHYRTLEFLMRHLTQLATFSPVTNMHSKNLAIVWAPNLLRSKQIESACFSGTAAFMEVRIQSVVVEFILNNTEALFSVKLNARIRESTGTTTLSRPKSLLVSSPSTKLLSLEEAQARTQAQLGSPVTTPVLSHSEYIEVGEGPGALMGKFHTVIELPSERKPTGKVKKSPAGSWRSFFHLGKSSSMVSKRKLKRHPSEPNEIKGMALPGGRGDTGTLRSTKSEESLTSLHNAEGEPQIYRPARPRSTSDALSTAFRIDLCDARVKVDRHNSPVKEDHNGADGTASSHQDDDLDLCLPRPAPGMAFLDFDPMSFQCSPVSPPTAKSATQRKASVNWKKNVGGSREVEPTSLSPNEVPSNSSRPDISPVRRKGEEKKEAIQNFPDRSIQVKRAGRVSEPHHLHSRPVLEADMGPLSASAQRCVSHNQGGETPSPPLDLREEGSVARAPSLPSGPLSLASTVTDSLASQKPPDTGTDRLVNSVSVLPPHPPLTSAARRLALTLAESAQKATLNSQRRCTQVPYPLQRQDTPCPVDRPSRPSVLYLQHCSQDYRDLQVSSPAPRSPLAGTLVESPSDHYSGHDRKHATEKVAISNFAPAVRSSEPGALLQGSTEVRDQRGRERPLGAVRPAHLQTMSPSYQCSRTSPPVQSIGSIQSQQAATVLANTDSVNAYNYRTVLAEACIPASVEEIPPRPPLPLLACQHSSEATKAVREDDEVYQRHMVNSAGHPQPDCVPSHLSGPRSMYKLTPDSLYSTLGSQNHPIPSPQYGGQPQPREERSSSDHHRSRGQWQRTEDRSLRYPVIRRARSFHTPQPSRVQLPETDVLLPETLFYIHRPAVQEKEHQWLVQSDIQPMQPYFENGRVQYRYNPYSDTVPPEHPYHYVDPFRTSRIRHSQSYTMRSTRDSGQPGYLYRPSHSIPSAEREHVVGSRDPGRVMYETWDDPDGFDRLVYQPIRQETRTKQRAQGPIKSPKENLGSPLPPGGIRGRDISHTRSRSDPGNACLLPMDRTDSQRDVPVVSPVSPGQQISDPCHYVPHQRGHWSGEEQVPLRRESVSRRSQSKHQAQAQLCNAPVLLDVKNTERAVGGHRRGRDQDRVVMGNVANSYSNQFRRPRPQGIKEPRRYQHVQPSADSDYPGSFSTQPHRRTPKSTKAMAFLYDSLEGYYPTPKLRTSRSGKATPGQIHGPFPGHGCMPPHNHLLLSQALGGHRAFLQTGLRPEARVYAE